MSLWSGTFTVTSQITLIQGLTLEGSGRGSTHITIGSTAGDWLDDMDAIILIPKNANLCTISDLSISGDRSTGFQDHNIDGIRILGYNWRPTVTNVEIVNCQGNGIFVTTGDRTDANAIVFEPIFQNISIISCNTSGMTLEYCADDALYSVNIEGCSNEGIKYFGGNGKWFDVHVYLNKVGMLIGGQPLRINSCSLDTNYYQGAIVESIDTTVSPGAVVFISPLAQANGASATDPKDACAILIRGQNVTITDMISINKNDIYQMYAVVEEGNADNNTIVNLTSQNVANTVLLVGENSVFTDYGSSDNDKDADTKDDTLRNILLVVLAVILLLILIRTVI